jgi:hypothetical protein
MGLNFLPWIKRKPVTPVNVAKVRFLAEQDGPVERRVKARWLSILSSNPNIRRAFLVRASYEDPNDIHVVLALCSNARPDCTLIEALRVPYAEIFRSDCPLDMVFPSPAQESEIAKVCRPFYAAAV